MWVAGQGYAVSCTTSTSISQASIGESEPWRDLLFSVLPPSLGLLRGSGWSGTWGLWECRRSKDEKGVSTKLAAPVSSQPNAMADQARPGACGASGHQVQGLPHLLSPLNYPFHNGSHAAGPWLRI